MEGYDKETYGERIADVYEEWFTEEEADDECIEPLVELAGPGPVLELGVGTGRLALALAARNLEVHGIDASPAMLAALAARPGSERIRAVLGDFADVGVTGSYSLILAVVNALFLLPSQEEQLRCFANVAARLDDGGVFAIEAFVPRRYPEDHGVGLQRLSADGVILAAGQHDPVAQRLDLQKILVTPGGVRLQPTSFRYAWPAELDLMGRLAGLRLRGRWGGWRRERFGPHSTTHVSLYVHADLAASGR